MNRKRLCSTFFFLFLLRFFAQGTLCAQEKKFNLYYYGVVTNVNDQNMLNITQDLFFAQLRGINYLDARDLRDDPIKDSYADIRPEDGGDAFFQYVPQDLASSPDSILFFARIYRPRSDEKWECVFFAKNCQSGEISSKGKNYDSYYKILTDAKNLIQALMAESSGAPEGETAQKAASPRQEAPAAGADSVAGTWGGESNVNKILLMRSGRGFIVFNNGATMNISVFVQDGGSSLRIVQRDKFNASFYPDIDRQTILGFAESAAPIEWNLTLNKSGELEGKKKTLVAAGGVVQPASVDVKWTRK